MSLDYQPTADDFETAEAALAICDSDSIAPAIRLLRDECGWPLSKSKQVLDLVCAARGGHTRALEQGRATARKAEAK